MPSRSCRNVVTRGNQAAEETITAEKLASNLVDSFRSKRPGYRPIPCLGITESEEHEMRVSVFQRVVPDYRIPFFLSLDRSLGDRDCKLEILAGQPWPHECLIDARDELPFIRKTRNKRISAKAYWLCGALKTARRADIVIIEQASAALYIYPLIAMRLLGITSWKLAFWGHGAQFNQKKPQPLRDSWKKFWTTKVDHFLAYTDLSAQAVRDCGFPAEKITVVQNSIDIQRLQEVKQSLPEKELANQFRELFGESRRDSHRVGVFCARLTPLKWVPFLLKSLEIIHRQYPDFRMIIIGDGSDADRVQAFCQRKPWCRWVGAVHGIKRVKYLAQADVFLNPGMTGLSILDAFSVGIPFVTTDCGIHSPEIAYLKNGINGTMSEPTESAFATAVSELIQSDSLAMIKQNALNDGKKYTIESMTRNFVEGVMKALA
jgi:glycosyltransferase involved in cell wall biosynthesis